MEIIKGNLACFVNIYIYYAYACLNIWWVQIYIFQLLYKLIAALCFNIIICLVFLTAPSRWWGERIESHIAGNGWTGKECSNWTEGKPQYLVLIQCPNSLDYLLLNLLLNALSWKQIDPTILGGLVVEFGQKVFDMSIRTRARQMERFLREPLNFWLPPIPLEGVCFHLEESTISVWAPWAACFPINIVLLFFANKENLLFVRIWWEKKKT